MNTRCRIPNRKMKCMSTNLFCFSRLSYRLFSLLFYYFAIIIRWNVPSCVEDISFSNNWTSGDHTVTHIKCWTSALSPHWLIDQMNFFRKWSSIAIIWRASFEDIIQIHSRFPITRSSSIGDLSVTSARGIPSISYLLLRAVMRVI